jgi:glycosyltransferase involved in cell wall biosynthesis
VASPVPEASRRRFALHVAPGHVGLDTRVFHKEARTLVDAGWDVAVVSRHDRHEVCDGVTLIPVPRPRNRLDRFLVLPFRLLWLCLRRPADVYHVHDFEALPVAVVLGLLGRRVVLDSHEDYPRAALDRPWIPRPLRWLAASLVRTAERLATIPLDAVISAEDVAAERFPAQKTSVVRNHVLASEFPLDAGDAPRRGLVYVGDITIDRGARQMVELAGRLHGSHGVRLTLAGRFSPPELRSELAALPGWDAVDDVGWLDRDRVQQALARAEVALVLLQPIRKYLEGALPVKLLEYLAAGVPVVASDFLTIRGVLAPDRCGSLVDPTDVEAAQQAVTRLLDDPEEARAMGRRGAAAVRRRYSWEEEARTLLAVYERVTA